MTLHVAYSDMILYAAIQSTVYLGLKAFYSYIWNGGRNR